MNEYANSAVSYYRHSGKAPLLGLVLIGIAGFVAVPILGLIYGYLSFYIPIIYLNILLAVAYPFAVGLVISQVAKYGKVRNTVLIGLAGLFFGLLAEYTGWIAWIAALGKDPSLLVEFFFPWDLLSIIPYLAETGVWSLNDSTPTGIFLYVIWLAEAITVIGGTTYFALAFVRQYPFCEESDTWAEKRSTLGVFAPLKRSSELKASLAQRGIAALDVLTPPAPGNAFTRLELIECADCNTFRVLNVKTVKISMNRGRRQTNESNFVSNILLPPSAYGSLQRMLQNLQPSQPQ